MVSTSKYIFLYPALVAGFLFSTLFLLPGQTFALENYQDGSVIFSDDFNDGNFNGWTVESGNWFIDINKQLAGYDFGTLKKSGRIRTDNGWDNYRIELDVKNDRGVDEGIGFRRADKDNTYEVTLRHGTGDFETPEVVLAKVEGGKNTKLFSTHQISLVNSKTYHIKIEAAEQHLQMWIDDSLVFDLDDKDTKVKTGSISLSYWTGDYGSSIVRFDNVKVTSINKLRYPVIFIAGIGGSELKTGSEVFWAGKPDGHGGNYSHAYAKDEKVWVNQDEAVKLGDDDYFDVLRLKPDGQTSEADISPNGKLTTFGYQDIDPFFADMGYKKNQSFYVFAYDWRKDVQTTTGDLDKLIQTAKQTSGQPKVNLVVHSMGGLVARNYILDQSRASNVNKLIELGVPHLGAPSGLKILMYGSALEKNVFGFISLGIPSSEVKDISQNSTGLFQLLPSSSYFNFYNISSSPFNDSRDIDNNSIIGPLSFQQLGDLLNHLNFNQTTFNLSNQFHAILDPQLNNTNGTKLYEIVGTGQPTLGQIRETWLINWPVKFIPKRDEIFINGDGTVPLYSASLKSDTLDLSANAKIYYVEQLHSDLVRGSGEAMQKVKTILNEGDILVKDQKIVLEGKQLSLSNADINLYDQSGNHAGLNDKGELENNIPNVFFDILEDNKHIFVKKNAPIVTATIISSNKTFDLRIRNYINDQITKVTIYKDVPTNNKKTTIAIDPVDSKPPVLTNEDQTTLPTSEYNGSDLEDQTPPTTVVEVSGPADNEGNHTGDTSITLTGNDQGSGVLKTQYSTDNGQTVQNYTGPITISQIGTTTIQIKSIDKAGNEETPQTITVKIIKPIAALSQNNGSILANGVSTVNVQALNFHPTANLALYDPDVFNTAVENEPKTLGISTLSLQSNNFEKNYALENLLKSLGIIVIVLVSWLTATFFQTNPRQN